MSEPPRQTTAKRRWKAAKGQIMVEKVVVDAILEERERKKKAKKAKKYCIKVIKFLASTIGLLLINIAWMVAGAFIFQHLEEMNELEGCRNAKTDYEAAENATLTLLMDMAQRLDGVGAMSDQNKLAVVEEFQGYLDSFALSVLDTGHDHTVDCEMMGKPNGTEFNWSWQGSLVFAVTVVTTIGYGHIAPATMWGRLVCIAYAILGIPTFLLALANVGEVLANLFRITYSTICCCGCCRKAPEKPKTKEELEKEEEHIQKAAAAWTIDPDTGRPIPPSEDIDDEEVEEEEEEEDDEEEEELTVPLTITLIVMFGFLFFGAAIFEFWEEDWDFIDSTYFCFITVSTIGFGDLVPSTDLEAAGGVFKSIATILYITFGMAALSMCFQLMADEGVAKFKWIGEKLGGAKKDENDPEDNDSEAGQKETKA